jgi:hypothetical protein
LTRSGVDAGAAIWSVRPLGRDYTTYMKRWRCSAILGCVLTVTFGRTVDAECVGFPLEHYVKYADVIFLGVVKDIREVDASKHIVTFEVSRVWKGPVRRTAVLYQAPWVAFDSYEFPRRAVGTQYLVFAARLTAPQRRDFALEGQQQRFAVPACGGGTTELRDIRDAPRQLGAGRKP